MKPEFYRQIFGKKNTQITNFMKICPVEADLFHAGRTDMSKLKKSLFSILRTRIKRQLKVKPSLSMSHEGILGEHGQS
jgi:hypothetical protein